MNLSIPMRRRSSLCPATAPAVDLQHQSSSAASKSGGDRAAASSSPAAAACSGGVAEGCSTAAAWGDPAVVSSHTNTAAGSSDSTAGSSHKAAASSGEVHAFSGEGGNSRRAAGFRRTRPNRRAKEKKLKTADRMLEERKVWSQEHQENLHTPPCLLAPRAESSSVVTSAAAAALSSPASTDSKCGPMRQAAAASRAALTSAAAAAAAQDAADLATAATEVEAAGALSASSNRVQLQDSTHAPKGEEGGLSPRMDFSSSLSTSCYSSSVSLWSFSCDKHHVKPLLQKNSDRGRPGGRAASEEPQQKAAAGRTAAGRTTAGRTAAGRAAAGSTEALQTGGEGEVATADSRTTAAAEAGDMAAAPAAEEEDSGAAAGMAARAAAAGAAAGAAAAAGATAAAEAAAGAVAVVGAAAAGAAAAAGTAAAGAAAAAAGGALAGAGAVEKEEMAEAAAAAAAAAASKAEGQQKTRPSKLDYLDPESDLAKSEYRGVAALVYVAALYYLVANPILSWYEKGEFVDPSLAEAMFEDFFFLMLMWGKLFAWSFTAYYLHVLYMGGRIGRHTLIFLQHSTQFILIAYAVSNCLYKDWPIIPAGFVQMIAVVQFMKMHSFTCVNLEFNDQLREGIEVEGYPANINLRNFVDYLFCPVLVYEPFYERGSGFRLPYFLGKLVSMGGAMMVMYLLCTSYLIRTIIQSPRMPLTEAILRLVFPFLFLGILIFFVLFECVCNLAAEITNFANRDFYGDWWNSRNWDEYSRKWNRPVHRFLLRHVYMEVRQRYRWNQLTASFVTFLFSALLHEMILAVCFRIIRFYLFGLMLLQIPLIALGRYYRHKSLIANCIFWACLMLGMPLLAIAYGREWAQVHFYAARADYQELRLF